MRELFAGLFDDAALFPPGDAPVAEAVPAHRALRERFGDLLGPFVIPAVRLDELDACLGDGDGAPFGVSVIAPIDALPGAVARVAADPRLELAAVEIPQVGDAAQARAAVWVLAEVLPDGAAAAIEIRRTPAQAAVLDTLAGSRYRAKLHTGGLSREHFPDEAELAATLAACQRRGLAVKCTAGLHHAVRHTAADTGFEHHGFLNVLLAADALAQGVTADGAADLLARRDGATIAAELHTWPAERAERARELCTSFGTCSVLEPVDDLVALGLLTTSERMPS